MRAGLSDVASDSLNSPLPDCPATPNCTRRSVVFSCPTSALYEAAQWGIEALGPVETRVVDRYHVHSVHRAGFFLDDLEFLAADHPEGSVLHVRSASRVGVWDLGVNGRRVRRFVRAVRRAAGD